jgi:hypothetical protein
MLHAEIIAASCENHMLHINIHSAGKLHSFTVYIVTSAIRALNEAKFHKIETGYIVVSTCQNQTIYFFRKCLREISVFKTLVLNIRPKTFRILRISLELWKHNKCNNLRYIGVASQSAYCTNQFWRILTMVNTFKIDPVDWNAPIRFRFCSTTVDPYSDFLKKNIRRRHSTVSS